MKINDKDDGEVISIGELEVGGSFSLHRGWYIKANEKEEGLCLCVGLEFGCIVRLHPEHNVVSIKLKVARELQGE
jgi:hypothetical protein